MKKLFIILLSLFFLLEFATLVDARGGRGGRGGGRGRMGRGRGGRRGGGASAAKAQSKVRDLERLALHRAARESLGREV
jgi:hypothetical protein